MSNKLHFILSPKFLFCYAVIALAVPNMALSITDHMPIVAAIANIVLPLSAYAIVMSLSRRPGRQVWILFPLVFFATFQMVLVYLYGGGVIATDMFLNLITTNPGEAMELLDNLVPAVTGVFVLYLPLLIIAAMQWSRHITLGTAARRPIRRLAIIVGAVAAMLTAALYAVYPKGEEKAGRFEYRVENNLYPINVFYNLYLAIHESWLSAHYQERVAGYRFDAVSRHDNDSTEVYILVIGETARSRDFQLYGYPRQTNPMLSKEKGLMVFKGVHSQSNTTHKSVPMLLTASTAEDHDRLYHEKGIIAAFREAGFHTAFFSNQQRNHSYIDFLGEEANDVCFIREHLANKFTYDSQLLPYVRRELAKHPKKLFMVLHMYGSHFNYRDRYPKADARFLPDLPTEAKAKNRRQLLNAYDNTILETDRFLANLISMLKKQGCISALLYTSDHGENIFDDSRKLFLHASPRPSTYDTDVPLMIWTSGGYDRLYASTLTALRRNVGKGVESNASVFPTMLSIGGIKTKLHLDSLSLANPAYKLGTRYYLNDHNHAVPLSAYGIR